MEMEKQEQQTFEEPHMVKQVDELTEEEEAALQPRKTRTAKNGGEAAVDGVEVSDGGIEGEVRQERPANGTEKEDLVLEEDERKIEGGADEVLGNGTGSEYGGQTSEDLVFYDNVEVINRGSANGGSTSTVDIEHKVNGSSFNAESNSSAIASDKKAEDLGIESSSDSKLQLPEISVEESSNSYRISSEIERAEDDGPTTVVDDLEFTDYDVEGVLKKQNTHDLYCPNCKSCITRRVILRKRKRTIQISGEGVKKNKVEATTGEVAIDDSQVPTVDDNDDDREREPFIFKCLSCFTFFIPIGFRDRSAKEPTEGQQPSNTRKTWSFASMFSANKLETTERGRVKTDVQGVAAIASANLGDQNAQTSMSPEKESSSEGKGKLSAANELDSTTVETIDVSVGQFESYTSDQLNESKVSKHVYSDKEHNSSVETFLKGSAVTNGVPEGHVKDGSKLLISSSAKESPSMNILEESQKPNLTSETEKEAIFFPSSISVHRDSHNDGKISISMAVPQEQQQDFTATIVTESIIDEKDANEKDRDNRVGEAHQHITTKTQFHVHTDETLKVDSISSTVSNDSAAQGKDTSITIDVRPSQPMQDIISPSETLMHPSTQVSITHQERIDQAREEFQIEIVKSIVYGGLAESITSLSVVSSAVGGGARTLNILALGMANLFGGLFILCHNIWELRSDNTVEVANQVSSDIQVPRRRDRYREILGRRENFVLHFFLSLTSYLVFGLVPPLAYGFSFRKSDDMEYKLFVVAASSLVCICLLATGRAYVQRPPKPYMKSVTTFVILGFIVSGVSFAAGTLVEKLLERLGLFGDSGPSAGLLRPETAMTSKTWASY